MPLSGPVNRFDNGKLFQSTEDHSAGQSVLSLRRQKRLTKRDLGSMQILATYTLFPKGLLRVRSLPVLGINQQTESKANRIPIKFSLKSCFQVDAKDKGQQKENKS